MPYTNTIVTTSTSGTWEGTPFSYNNISLIDGIPHSAQLEVERVFTVPRTTGNYSTIEDFLNNTATTQKDKQQVFIIPASRITFNETSKTITAINLPSTGDTYDFNPDGDGLANVPVPAIVSGTSVLKIRRKTVSNQTLVEWSAGTKLTSAQLNLETKQLIHLIQELIDKTTTEVNVSNTTIGTVTNYSITPIKLSAGGPAWNSSSFLGIGMTPTTRTLSVFQASTPSIQLVNSTTGSLATDGGVVWMSGNDMLITNQEAASLKFETNTAERMRIESGGNLIIGDVNAAGNTTRNLDIYNYTNGASAASIVRLITNNTSGAASSIGQIVKYQTGSFAIQNTDTNATAHIRLDVGNSERMRIDSSGNVGIGTANPQCKLSISTTNPTNGINQLLTNTANSSHTGSQIQITQNTIDDWAIGQPPGVSAFAFYQGRNTSATGNERMRISATGNVGIGTDNPTTKLAVNGTTSISGITTLSSTEAATNTTSGALQVGGGVGISGSVYAAEVRAPTIVATSVFNGNLYGNIGSTIVVLVPNFATALTATATSGFCSKSAASNVVNLPSGTWIGYAINMSAAGVISSIANIPATSGGAITTSNLTSGSTNIVNLHLMRSS